MKLPQNLVVWFTLLMFTLRKHFVEWMGLMV
ncbi:hypothetical protein QFZ80_000635 [Paenibacillus sp. V4I7]|nr:hypothetical protein [Paenibacillus sp. V4I7]